MSGYIIELYKNIISDEKYWTEQSISKSELKNKIYMTFGEFDKMTVSKTNAFSRMRDVSEMSRDWIGDRQKIFLFELADNNQLEYRESEKECGFFIHQGTACLPCTKLFLGITIFQFKESQEESQNDNIKETLNTCRKNILNIVAEQKMPVECSVFGILGTYGVAVIWAADQYTDVLKLINRIKGTDILSEESSRRPAYKFISVFTIFAKNKDWHNEEKISQLEGKALLQITLQTNLNKSMLLEIMEKIPESNNFHTVGEYDLMVETPVRNLYACFDKGAIFDPASNFYKYHILQTNVKLCELVTDDYLDGIEAEKPKRISRKKQDEDNVKLHISEIEKKYKNLREMFFEKFPKTAGMVDSLDLMYGDYHSKIAFVSNKMWAVDYSQQFLAILTLLEKNLNAVTAMKHDNINTSDFLEDVQDILNCFEYQTIHISESNNLLLNTPKCHLRYTGQNNLVLYAYFGIIKDLIEFAYRMQKESRQSRIIPLISVDTVPEISSLLFMDNNSPFEDRLIKFNFPMMALYALPVYVPYLYHEIFHYVAPRDRVVRNQAKGCILSFCAVKNVICELLYSENNNQDYEMALDITENVLNCRIYSVVVDNYSDSLVDKIKNISGVKYEREMVNKEAVSWIKYEECLIELLMKYIDESNGISMDSNLIYIVLSELYYAREEIMKECQFMFAQGASQEKGEEVLALLSSFMLSLEGIFRNGPPETKLKAFQKIIKDTGKLSEDLISIGELIQISDAIKEVVCDMPMVELARLDVTAYLITYVKIQNDLLKQEDSESQIQHYIRLGVVLDSFFKWDIGNAEKQDKLEALRYVFVQSYVGLYFSEKQSQKTNGLNDYVKKIEDKANNWFDKIKYWYREYLKRYSIFSRLLQIIVKQSSITSIKDCFEKENYDLYEKFNGLKTMEYHDSVRLYGIEIINLVNTPDFTDEKKREEIAVIKERFQKEVFAYNIDIILGYQKQKNFEELGTICTQCFKGKELYQYVDEFPKNISVAYANNLVMTGSKREVKPYQYKIQGLNGLIQTIRKLADSLGNQGRKQYGDKGDALWYRGHQDSSYILLPSAMRKYAQCTRAGQSLRDYQIGAYGEFKFRMENASDKIDKTGYTECDYLALMQHHGAPTIYMDWSENAISALYFALEAFMDPDKKDKQDDRDAALYILHPNLYNEARNRMMDRVSVKSGRKLDYMMKDSRLTSTRSLPNLSIQYHSGNMGMFLLGEVSDERDIVAATSERIESLSLNRNPENILYLPLAIYASRANARVRAQSGMFMAYNIFTKPSGMKYFDYMALENIQKFYLDIFPDASPFLYSIVIDGSIKKDVAEWLKIIGVSKDMIYPELANIGERIG